MSTKTVKHTYQLKRGNEDILKEKNPALQRGEPIIVFCNDGSVRFKAGDGINMYNDLPFIGGSVTEDLVNELIDGKVQDVLDKLSTSDMIKVITEDVNICDSDYGLYVVRPSESLTINIVPDDTLVTYDEDKGVVVCVSGKETYTSAIEKGLSSFYKMLFVFNSTDLPYLYEIKYTISNDGSLSYNIEKHKVSDVEVVTNKVDSILTDIPDADIKYPSASAVREAIEELFYELEKAFIMAEKLINKSNSYLDDVDNIDKYPSVPTMLEAIRNEAPQADYDQNDETAMDYIKNRPFYKEGKTPTIVTGTLHDSLNSGDGKPTLYSSNSDIFIFDIPFTSINNGVTNIDSFIDKNSPIAMVTGSKVSIQHQIFRDHNTKTSPKDTYYYSPTFSGTAVVDNGTFYVGNPHLVDSTEPNSGDNFCLFYNKSQSLFRLYIKSSTLYGSLTLSAADSWTYSGESSTSYTSVYDVVINYTYNMGDGVIYHKIDPNFLPSYVDDVIEGYYNENNFYVDDTLTTLIEGERSKIYVDLSSNKSYRWSGSTYIEIASSMKFSTTIDKNASDEDVPTTKTVYNFVETSKAQVQQALSEIDTNITNLQEFENNTNPKIQTLEEKIVLLEEKIVLLEEKLQVLQDTQNTTITDYNMASELIGGTE